jgi:hypothetical protein
VERTSEKLMSEKHTPDPSPENPQSHRESWAGRYARRLGKTVFEVLHALRQSYIPVDYSRYYSDSPPSISQQTHQNTDPPILNTAQTNPWPDAENLSPLPRAVRQHGRIIREGMSSVLSKEDAAALRELWSDQFDSRRIRPLLDITGDRSSAYSDVGGPSTTDLIDLAIIDGYPELSGDQWLTFTNFAGGGSWREPNTDE